RASSKGRVFPREVVEQWTRFGDKTKLAKDTATAAKVMDTVNGFDEWFITAEDIDLNFRAVSSGFTLGYNDDAIIYHRTKGSFIGFFKQAFWNGWGRKQLTMKYGNLWSSYKPQRLFETSVSFWALARLGIALLGYLMCKLFEHPPEYISTLQAERKKRKRSSIIFPGR
ncbi:MAG: hypothetical protein MUO84_05495, partial [Thermoplasmata archaeon]|nr:hypothetical protein [Thermoplasmata archaeon]